jgi:hypothetical protein
MRVVRWFGWALLSVLLLALLGFTIWAYTPLGPMPEAVEALGSDGQVTVEANPWLSFSPSAGASTTGLIIYPGGRVDFRSYAPTARAIAEAGHLVVIVPMPFNLAVFGANRAERVIDAHPEIERWAVGGHSLGGAMAAQYAFSHPGEADGLVLWASYPPGNSSLADRALAVVSVYGSEDGLATLTEIEDSRVLLPVDTRWVPIEGGNHAGFGWYGVQGGDGKATISRADQQEQIVSTTRGLLTQLDEAGP